MTVPMATGDLSGPWPGIMPDWGDVQVLIGPGVLNQLPSIITSLQRGTTVVAVYDGNTHRLLGPRVTDVLRQGGFTVRECLLGAPGQGFDPNEQAVALVAGQLAGSPAVLMGVGSGALNDLCKYVATQRGVPYVGVPTAPSVDGYASPIAALHLQGVKTTFPVQAPRAVVADLDVLTTAPTRLVLSGFGDLVGKLTSLRDWELAQLLFHEPFAPDVATRLEQVALDVLGCARTLATKSPAAVQRLMEGLLLAGLAVCRTGNSRPTSGGEHLISHFVEMERLNHGQVPPLHGEVVGLATLLVCHLVERLRALSARELPAHPPDLAESPATVLAHLNLTEVPANFGLSKFDPQARQQRLGVIRAQWERIQGVLAKVPPAQALRDALVQAGGTARWSDLGLDPQMVRTALLEARFLRERYTVLDLAGDLGLLPTWADALVAETV